MMKNRYLLYAVICFLLFFLKGQAQERPGKWDLKTCIAYAREQNIQIRKNKVAFEESLENALQAKAQRLPSLNFSSSHNYVNRPQIGEGDPDSYTGTYSLNLSLTLYQGGKVKKNIRQMDLQSEVRRLAVEEAENNIELAITQAYIQVLYAHENVRINENTVEVSKAQRDRGKQLMDAGALSRPDFAQLESQYTSSQYQLVVANSDFANSILDLKQLLELGIEEQMQPEMPVLPDDSVLCLLPPKEKVCEIALGIMPEVKYSQLNIRVADMEKQKAWAGYMPELNLSAGIGSSHISGTGYTFGNQFRTNWSENIGLTLSVPVFSNRSNKTAVNLARLNIENAELEYKNIQKELLKTIENIYQDAVSAQERFRAAKENLVAVEESFRLMEQQFFLGMKNTLEMLTEKNNLLSAQQEMLQAKYMAVLNCQLLNFYQGKEISI